MSSKKTSKSKNRSQLSKAASASPAAGNNPWAGPAVLILETLSILSLTPLATLASQLALHPLYGSTTTSLHFKTLAQVACVSSITRPTMPAHRLLLFIAVILAAAPMSAKVLGSWTGRMGDYTLGPVITQLALSVPLIGLASVLVRTRLAPILSVAHPMVSNILSPALVYGGIHYVEPLLWRSIPFGGFFTSCNMFLGLSTTASLAAALSTPIKGSKPRDASRSLISSGILVAIPLLIASFTKSQSPCQTPKLPATFRSVYYPSPANTSAITKLTRSFGIGILSPEADPENGPANITVNLLARSDSVTGTIVVGEFVEEGFRYLRADHSLLGGRWIGEKTYGAPLGESVYGAFTLQEAVRLVQREHVKESENVLNIGLGIGIAADALIRHGHKVHVVEIDPAVYTYARDFFNMSEPHAVHLVDARRWVHEQSQLHKIAADNLFHFDYSNSGDLNSEPAARNLNANKFAMVIHDCFSGGGVPSHIFTLEFWDELKEIMTPDGVLAVNFAGHIGTEAARAIWYTLEEAFSPEKGGRGCRVFHDRVADPSKPIEENVLEEDAFLNMVYFCQKNDKGSASAGGGDDDEKRVEFRRATEEDYLRSWLRNMILSTMLDREVSKEQITGAKAARQRGIKLQAEDWVLTDANNRLVMPYNVWEIY